jgi:hypothetical protein
MRLRIALAAIAAVVTTSSVMTTAGHARQSVDSLSWTQTTYPSDTTQVRWRLSAERSQDLSLLTPITDGSETFEITRIAGQVDFYPFGDEFFLSAGAVRPVDDDTGSAWRHTASDPAWATFPHANLIDQSAQHELDELTRYFGAGITVRELNQWSLTLEGGAYFRDRAKDRLNVAGFDAIEGATLLDNLDRVERAAVGDTQARSIKPVGHLVFRRRF